MKIAACAASRHQSAASPPVYGGFAIVIAVVAPSVVELLQEQQHVRAVLRVRRAPRRHRLRAEELVLGDQGVAQPVTCTAKSNSRFALSAIVAGSAGGTVVPTRLFKLQVEEDRRRARARIAAGTAVPDETASTSPGFGVIGASWPA